MSKSRHVTFEQKAAIRAFLDTATELRDGLHRYKKDWTHGAVAAQLNAQVVQAKLPGVTLSDPRFSATNVGGEYLKYLGPSKNAPEAPAAQSPEAATLANVLAEVRDLKHLVNHHSHPSQAQATAELREELAATRQELAEVREELAGEKRDNRDMMEWATRHGFVRTLALPDLPESLKIPQTVRAAAWPAGPRA